MFLFGSGADTDANGYLKSGQSFASTLLLNGYAKQIEQITDIEASSYKLLYPNSKKIYVQSIMNKYKEDTDSFDEDTQGVFGGVILDKIKAYYKRDSEEDEKINITDLCKKWYKLLTGKIENDEDKKEKNFFLKNAVFFDSLDEKFNSLRNNKLNSNAKRVIVAYWNVYLQIFNALYGENFNDDLSYEKIFDILGKDQYKNPISNNCYYKSLKNSKLETIDDYLISTANYTSILSNVFCEKNISYLHGRLNWFEDLKNLQVYDCNNKDEKEQLLKNIKDRHTVIPFILIPSGVKPLICKRQINQFSKFIDNLDSCNKLVVVGYRFNSEDNHINSIIGEWLSNSGKQLIFFSYNNNINIEQLSWLPKENKKTIDFKGKHPLISNDYKSLCINVNENNAIKAFEQLIKELEDKQ